MGNQPQLGSWEGVKFICQVGEMTEKTEAEKQLLIDVVLIEVYCY